MTTRPTVYQFGSFRFDPSQFELRRGEERATLPVAMNKLLFMFVSAPGKLITRDQIAAALWVDQGTVDTTAGVYTAIKRLRDQLGNEEGQDAFIQTVVGAGYRFTAPVSIHSEPISASNEQAAELAATSQMKSPEDWPTKTRRLPVILSGFVLLAMVSVVGAWSWFALVTKGQGKSVPATGSNAIVELVHPVTFNEGKDGVTAQALSPNGRFIAWSDHKGINLTTLEGSGTRSLLAPHGLAVSRIAWFPDNATLLVTGTATEKNAASLASDPSEGQIWRVSANGEPPRLLVADAALGSVSSSGSSLCFTRASQTEIWVAAADGTAAHRLIGTTDGSIFTAVLWAVADDQILASHSQAKIAALSGAKVSAINEPQAGDTHGFVSGYEIYDATTGKLIAHHNSEPFDSAVPVRGKTFLCFLGRLSGRPHWMMLDIDKGFFPTPVQTSPDRDIPDDLLIPEGQLSASNDGHMVSFLAKRISIDVTIADLSRAAKSQIPHLENASRPVHHALINYPTAWSPDGKTIAFDQGFHGANAVLGQRIDSPNTVTFAGANGSKDIYAQGHFSPDGKWLLYLHLPPDGQRIETIERVPSTGGEAHVVPVRGQIESFTCSVSKVGRCVLRELDDQKAIVYYDLDPIRGQGKELARVPWQPVVLGDWSISPDGTAVVMADHSPGHPALQLVSLGSETVSNTTKEIPLRGLGTILEPTWSADGQGFFVETAFGSTYQLLFVDSKDHKTTLLRQSPDLMWGVPSPDGRHIAFPENTNASSNAWLGLLSNTLVK